MRRIILMLALVTAGELSFGLAFNVPRFFRPTMLDVFGFTNTELGDIFAPYGVVAMLSYFPGGVLADRYSARSLITVSLVSTSLGGVYMATIPGVLGMQVLYGFWGLTSIFLFWGALIRATRDWGGSQTQGVAFGVLDGGRGLVAVVVATIGVYILAFYLPYDVSLASIEERETAFRYVVWFYSLLTFLAGVFSWYAIPEEKRASGLGFNPLKGMGAVLRRPIIWAQAGIIVCAYCGYKGLDNFSLYANQVLGMNEVDSSSFAATGAWARPVAAVVAGLVADRFQVARSLGAIFVIFGISCLAWFSTAPSGSGMMIIYLNLFTTFGAVYGLRAIYFALLEENRTPKFITGAAVGLVSVIGFTPDVFFGPITGRILDANPGLVGHQNYFLFLAVVAALGLLVVFCMFWLRRRGVENLWPDAPIGEK